MSGHPAQLPWYVAGRLPDDEMRSVREHVEACEECSETAAHLAAMERSLSATARPHVDAELLVRYENGEAIEGDERIRIEAHLTRCDVCRDDLDILKSVRRELRPARRPILRRAALAAAAVVLLAVAWPLASWWWGGPAPGEPPWLPSSRSGAPHPSLAGPGPWSLTIHLPMTAPEGNYRARIENLDGRTIRMLPGPWHADSGRLRLTLESLGSSGSYLLVLEPQVAHPSGAFIYPFEVEG